MANFRLAQALSARPIYLPSLRRLIEQSEKPWRYLSSCSLGLDLSRWVFVRCLFQWTRSWPVPSRHSRTASQAQVTFIIIVPCAFPLAILFPKPSRFLFSLFSLCVREWLMLSLLEICPYVSAPGFLVFLSLSLSVYICSISLYTSPSYHAYLLLDGKSLCCYSVYFTLEQG